jgi:signal transduction histidine kinase
LSAFAAVEQLDGDKRTVLYRVAQEALTNIARHAKASQAEVKLQKLDGAVRMTITDDGKGFQTERGVHTKKGKRLGLLGMRERLEIVGGNFAVTSAPGKGTTVLAQVPLTDRRPHGCGELERGHCCPPPGLGQALADKNVRAPEKSKMR